MTTAAGEEATGEARKWPRISLATQILLALGLGVLGHVKSEHADRMELLSWYWHFVDVVWIAVFTVVYVVGY